MAKAIEIVNEDLDQEMKREVALRDRLLNKIPKEIEDTVVLGHPKERLPGSAGFCFKGVDGESILLKMDMEGIICSTGSPCSSGSLKPSPVLLALGMSRESAKGSLRLSLGRQSTEEEIDRVLGVLPPAVSSLRNISRI